MFVKNHCAEATRLSECDALALNVARRRFCAGAVVGLMIGKPLTQIRLPQL
jgi:hypothetical protein